MDTSDHGAARNSSLPPPGGLGRHLGVHVDVEGPSALDDAIDDAPRPLSNCAERVMRMVMVGREM
jgi:hypothetical protein